MLENLSAGYCGREVIHDVTMTFRTGEIVCLLGPNGSGKTTLFRSILGLHPSIGAVRFIDHQNCRFYGHDRSKLIAYVPQLHVPPFPFTGLDVVLAGRTPFIGMFGSPSKNDYDMAFEALERADADSLAARNYAELSGGERQLVLIARALAQSPRFLVMDEPTSHLDYGNQLKIMRTIRALASNGMGIILTTHTPDHVFICATRVIALHHGSVIADGPPLDALTEAVLGKLYGIRVELVTLPDGRRLCTPLKKEILAS